MVPHPSFVYSAIIINSTTIITGCFDQILRVWTNDENLEYVLHQELNGHKGYITAACCNKKGHDVYSSDSVGIVIHWQLNNDGWFLKK